MHVAGNLKPAVVLVAGLLLLLTPVPARGVSAAKEQVPIKLTAEAWSGPLEHVGAERQGVGYQLEEVDRALRFGATGLAGVTRTVRWTTNVEGFNLADYPYVIMEYRSSWLNDQAGEVVGVGSGPDSGEPQRATLFRLHDLISDGRWHTAILKSDLKHACQSLSVRLQSRSTQAFLEIRSLTFAASEKALKAGLAYQPVLETDKAFQCVNLDERYDISYQEVQERLLSDASISVNDGGRYFSSPSVAINGIPFRVRTEGKNLVRFPPDPADNEEIIDHFGMKLKRRYVSPLSRDGQIEIRVGAPVSEIFFLLAVDHPTISPVAASRRDFRIEDVECFAVQLKYADGLTDYAFPFSIGDQRHVIQRTMGAYVVPTNGRELESVVFHNRILGKEIYLGAVTLNRKQERLFPRLAEDPVRFENNAQVPPVLIPRAPYIEYKNRKLSIGNSSIDLQIDPANAFAIIGLTNRRLAESPIVLDRQAAGLELTIGEKRVAPPDLELVGVSPVVGADAGAATVTYALAGEVPVELQVNMSVNDRDPEVGLRLTVRNQSDEAISAKILFPVFKIAEMGQMEDVWYMYPSFRTLLSNQPGRFEHLYSLSFPLQFYDVYNPKLGGGFYLATRETDVNEVRRYGLSKSSDGITCHIEYPALHTLLEPMESLELCKTVIGVHSGDWRAAANQYRNWLSTWYKPLKSQDKSWYKKLFWLLCDYMDTVHRDVTAAIRTGFEGWYDPAKRRYRMDDVLNEHKQSVGRYPDIFHFWSWTWNMPRPYVRFGAYGTNGEYESLGGMENFRNAINDVKKKLGLEVSIYLDASLCNPDLPIGRELGSGAAMQLRDGTPQSDYRARRMCPGVKGWREYMQETYKRVNRELGVNILYVDEWAPPWYHGRDPISVFNCWASDHEHERPANMNLAVHQYMKELRSAVPDHAALYGEYQDVDVNSQFYDGTINYYLARWAADFSEGRDNISYDLSPFDSGLRETYLNLYRYLIPGQVTLSLPNDVAYYSWHPLKFTFLNGDAVYDSFWSRDQSKAEAFMVKSFDLKKEYSDCFRSDHPEMLVSTERSSVIANLFPGNERNLWTLYNYDYKTVRGQVLKVKHTSGARYFDVWNNEPLEIKIQGGEAVISLTLHAQEVGCVLQTLPGGD
jgi:hypothetical protein